MIPGEQVKEEKSCFNCKFGLKGCYGMRNAENKLLCDKWQPKKKEGKNCGNCQHFEIVTCFGLQIKACHSNGCDSELWQNWQPKQESR